jgi:AbiV family abortive infection protein
MSEQRKNILENAQRLQDDARFLCDAGRYASCALLQIFCFEELGKYHLAGLGTTHTKNWHNTKQETALSLAGGRAFERLMDEKCRSMGWDYWRNAADADAFDRWFLEHGDEELHKLNNVSSWFNHARKGFLETLRRIAAYVDVGDNAVGKNLVSGVTYDYKSIDLPFVTTAFAFIQDAFECLESEIATHMADLLRTEIWKRKTTH